MKKLNEANLVLCLSILTKIIFQHVAWKKRMRELCENRIFLMK